MFNLQVLYKRETQWIILIVLLVVVIILSVKKEAFGDFSGVWGDLASYPEAFMDKVATPFTKSVISAGSFEPAASNAGPMVPEMNQLQLEAQKVVAPVSIGERLAIHVEVSVPAQTVDVPAQTSSQAPASLESSDKPVPAQEITIPAQTGIIPGKVDDSGNIIGIPVSIPEQKVMVAEQMAHVQVMEGFRI